MQTYCTDVQVADSACTATAYLTGVKTDTDTIGLDANVEFKNCDTQNNPAFQLESVMTWAQVLHLVTQNNLKRKVIEFQSACGQVQSSLPKFQAIDSAQH